MSVTPIRPVDGQPDQWQEIMRHGAQAALTKELAGNPVCITIISESADGSFQFSQFPPGQSASRNAMRELCIAYESEDVAG